MIAGVQGAAGRADPQTPPGDVSPSPWPTDPSVSYAVQPLNKALLTQDLDIANTLQSRGSGSPAGPTVTQLFRQVDWRLHTAEAFVHTLSIRTNFLERDVCKAEVRIARSQVVFRNWPKDATRVDRHRVMDGVAAATGSQQGRHRILIPMQTPPQGPDQPSPISNLDP